VQEVLLQFHESLCLLIIQNLTRFERIEVPTVTATSHYLCTERSKKPYLACRALDGQSTAAFMLKVDRHSDAQFLWVSELFYKGVNIECKIDSDCE
jgi:hypothetical protein